jgi:hypothetical protein
MFLKRAFYLVLLTENRGHTENRLSPPLQNPFSRGVGAPLIFSGPGFFVLPP